MTGQAQKQGNENVAPGKKATPSPQANAQSEANASNPNDKSKTDKQGAQAKPKTTPQTTKQTPIIPLRKDKPPKQQIEKKARFFSIGYFKGLRPQQFRRVILALSFMIAVVLPALLGSAYFLFLASDRYSTKVGFAVRSVDGVAVGSEFLGALTGAASSGSTKTDNYILLEYLKSREVLEKLGKDFNFRQAFSNSEIDFIYRMDEALPIEEVEEYWRGLISTTYDNTSGIITFEVQGFTAKQSLTLAELILQYSDELVNRLSAKARQDTEKFANQELARAELRLRFVREQMQKFREREQLVDPKLDMQAQISLISGLEQQLIDVRSRIASITGIIEEDSPTYQQLKRRENALLSQITAQNQLMTGTRSGKPSTDSNPSEAGNLSSLSTVFKDYEALQLDLELAQKGYALAQSSLEQARAEASRQQRYLAVYLPPNEPGSAIYPKRVLNSFVLVLLLVVVWSIGTLIVYSVRDHLR